MYRATIKEGPLRLRRKTRQPGSEGCGQTLRYVDTTFANSIALILVSVHHFIWPWFLAARAMLSTACLHFLQLTLLEGQSLTGSLHWQILHFRIGLCASSAAAPGALPPVPGALPPVLRAPPLHGALPGALPPALGMPGVHGMPPAESWKDHVEQVSIASCQGHVSTATNSKQLAVACELLVG
jgi:hypothetical protein